ncbi:cadherin domain-containing protein [Ditylenchus destructor]|uniref:Cadherin domain-containing protein n=1 Tax=Ditylenchus destructor TaxID=166010 RepID=A0AAD4R1W1_9BILA|nr:cadherin domain-containing protein [Ditylenchus destructor]
MKNPWLRPVSALFIFLLSPTNFAPLISAQDSLTSSGEKCSFPESEVQPFFFDIRADTPPQSVIVDTVVEPPTAQLRVANIRSNNLANVDFTEHFYIEQRASGQFLLVTQKPLNLPDYPSKFNETLLYATVLCNGRAHPLITIRLRNTNNYSPQLFGQPYEVVVVKGSSLDSIFPTSLLALDRDPAEKYPITYSIENGPSYSEFELAPMGSTWTLDETFEAIGYSNNFSRTASDWSSDQLPAKIGLRPRNRLTRPVYYLNVSANDNGSPNRKAYAQLKIVMKNENEITAHFTQPEYILNFTRSSAIGSDLIPNHQIMAIFPDSGRSHSTKSDVIYETVAGRHSDMITVHPDSARVQLNHVPPYEDISAITVLELRAFREENPESYVTTKLILNDVTEVKLTHFVQCHYEAHLLENPSAYTRVLQFSFKGDVDGVELLNGTEYFEVDSYGTMSVKPKAKIDREEISRIVVKARLRSTSALHPKSLELCQIATADILIDDMNDHTPRFEKNAYTFSMDSFPYNNTEVGSLKATDKDKGEFGRVRYRILEDEYESVPFIIFQADGTATIYYVTKIQDYFPEKSYTFTVEAFDAENFVDARTSRVSVRILLESEAERQKSQQTLDSPSPIQDNRDTSSNGSAEDDPEPTLGPESEEEESEETIAPSTTTRAPKRKPHSKGKERRHRISGHKTVAKHSETEESEDQDLEEKSEDVEQRSRKVEVKSSKKNMEIMQANDAEDVEVREPELVVSNVKFESDSYTFSLKGKLDEGEYIGTIHIHPNSSALLASGDQQPVLEYAVEEGIAGFVEVDPYTGRLTVGRDLAKDNYEEIRFSAAVQRGGGWVLATTLVTVVMDDGASIYDLPPAFEQAFYRFEVEENVPTGRIGKIEAHHRAVELGKDRLWYVLDRHSRDTAFFRVEPETGWLSHKQPLDAEQRRNYKLKVSACLETNTSSCAIAEVAVVVLDINDNPPEFNRSSFDVPIPMNLPIGSELIRISASDADTGKNGQVIYSMRTSYAFQQLFEIDPNTGSITLAKKLNGDGRTKVEPGTMYRVDVDATDKGPEFEKFRYEVVFNSSSIPRGTFITQVHAMDPDGGVDGKVKYRFADPADQTINAHNGAEELVKQYTIDSETGKISTIANVAMPQSTGDIESEDVSNEFHHTSSTQLLVVEAVDQSQQFPRRSQTVVVIKFNPAQRDSAAQTHIEFNPLPKTVFISSAKQPNSSVLRISSKIVDINGVSIDSSSEVSYTVSNSDTDYFQIRDDYLTVNRKLEPGEYDIQIRAELAKNSAVTALYPIHVVVMTDRDKYPVFDKLSYEMNVDSDAHLPLKLAPLNATVTNGRAGYSLLAQKGKQAKGIDVDSITGQLTILEPIESETFVAVRATNLDFPKYYSDVGIILTAHKTDLNTPSSLSFDSQLYRLIAKEGDPAGTVINSVALGVQNPDKLPDIQLKFDPESDDFGILANGSVLTRRKLDVNRMDNVDEKGVVHLKVIAQSGESSYVAKSRVQIAIVGQEKSITSSTSSSQTPPMFDQPSYVFELRSPVQSGNQIGQVNAKSADDNPMTYRAISGSAAPYFEVNPTDGTVRKISFRQLESGKSYDLEVEAVDNRGQTAKTSVKIIVNYVPLSTAKPKVKVHELGVKTWSPTQDKDTSASSSQRFMIGEELPSDSKWEFRIASGNERGHFQLSQVNNSMAQLELIAPPVSSQEDSPFSHESASPTETVLIEAVNQDDPLETAHEKINVDINQILEHKSREKASEKSKTLEEPVESRAEIIVKFADTASNPQGLILVEGREQKAEFNQPIYWVQATAKAKSRGHGTALPVRYSIVENSPDNLFRIDPETGRLYINSATSQSNSRAPSSVTEEFELLVKAEVNTSSIAENIKGRTSAQRLYIVRMISEPETTTSSSAPSLTSGFGIEVTDHTSRPRTSPEFVTSTLAQSKENQVEGASASISIEEFASSTSPTVRFTISGGSTISEEIQEKLRFELDSYHFVVNSPLRGEPVGQFNLRGESGSRLSAEKDGVQISVEPREFLDWFSVDPRSSTLYIREVPPNLYGKQRAQFHVALRDINTSDLIATANVTVDLIFPSQTSTTLKVPLPSTSAFVDDTNEITTTEPFTDRAETSNSITAEEDETTTSLHSSSSSSTFTQEPVTGQFVFTPSRPADSNPTLAHSLDQSVTSVQHSLDRLETTGVTESTFVETTQALAQENGPIRFPYEKYTAMLPEGRYGSSGALVSLRPQPLRQGMPPGQLYAIDSPDQPQLPFFVRNDTGELIAFAEIDRETFPEYKFRVIATHPQNVTPVASTMVHIQILDVNDNYPAFLDPPHVLAIDRLTPPGQLLARLQATDPDEGRLGQISYRLESDGGGLFELGTKTGDLTLAKTIPIQSEKEDVIELQVAAQDGGRPALKTIHKVRVEIFADSLGRPSFKQAEYTADKVIVPEESGGKPSVSPVQNGTFVAQVVAGTSNFTYSLDQSKELLPRGLFQIDKTKGMITFGRRPAPTELDKQYELSVTATGEDGSKASTKVNVLIESDKRQSKPVIPVDASTEVTAVSSLQNDTGCTFTSRAFHAEIKENVSGKHKLTTVKSSGCRPGMRALYTIHQGTEEFELDPTTGDFYVIAPLDREKRSLHFIVLNITEVKDERAVEGNTERSRRSKESEMKNLGTGVNPIVEYTKNKLQEGQALVVVRVIDENDNPPSFARLTPDGVYAFPVDWQANVLQAVARVQAFDPDEKANLTYYLTHALGDEHFVINKSSGVVSVIKSLMDASDDVFHLEVAVTDGTNEARAPLKLYKLQPGVNIVIVESDQPVDKVDELLIVRQLSAGLDLDVRVLLKQVYIGEDGHADPTRSHLLVYALDRLSRIPVDASTLKSMLEERLPAMKQKNSGDGSDQITHLGRVSAPLNGSQFQLSIAEYVLLGVSAVLLVAACCLLFLMLRCCKKRQMAAKADLEYMVDSEQAGPRPYNVELITRKMAQSILASRPLPDPYEEVTMTPESRATMIATASTFNQRDATSATSSAIQQRDSEQPVSSATSNSANPNPASGAKQNQVFENSTSSESLGVAEAPKKRQTTTRPAPAPPSVPQSGSKHKVVPAVSIKPPDV